MDYKEAIDRITDHKEIHFQKEYPRAIKITEALEIAISAMQELIRYEDKLTEVYGEHSGMIETIVDGLVEYGKTFGIKNTIKARLLTNGDVDLWKEYKQLGTLEEVREAVDKQNSKKPILDKPLMILECPSCGNYLQKVLDDEGSTKGFIPMYCKDCGQKIDAYWSDENETD